MVKIDCLTELVLLEDYLPLDSIYLFFTLKAFLYQKMCSVVQIPYVWANWNKF